MEIAIWSAISQNSLGKAKKSSRLVKMAGFLYILLTF